ncbi:hypothetical protein [Mucilaginibacter sp.]|uniref:hypothetical protein n=1 Tax=Mucilaginibacter sp. TaxID=1882438 RepID=UPI003AFFB57B
MEKQAKKTSFKKIVTIFFLSLVLFIWFFISIGKHYSTTSEPLAATNEAVNNLDQITMAQKLALVETDDTTFKAVDDPYVKQLDRLLTQLSDKYNEPKDTIAEQTHKIQSRLFKHYHVYLTSAYLMNEVNITKRMDKVKYWDMITMYGMIYSTGK